MTFPVVSIAYHSGYGHTAVLAEAVASGAVQAGAETHLIKVDEITDEQWAVLDRSDAIFQSWVAQRAEVASAKAWKAADAVPM